MRRATARTLAVLVLLVAAGALTACDPIGQQTGNAYQRAANSIP
jgi:hypothetical protein